MQDDNLVGTIPTLHPTYEISFDYKPTAFMNNWSNLFQLTTAGSDVTSFSWTAGDRIQAVFLQNDGSGRLHVATDQNGTPNTIHLSLTSLTLNEWNNIHIRRFSTGSTYTYEISLNGNVYSSETGVTDDTTFSNVNVYAKNPSTWDPTPEGSMRNLQIQTPYSGKFFFN